MAVTKKATAADTEPKPTGNPYSGAQMIDDPDATPTTTEPPQPALTQGQTQPQEG